MNRSKLTHSPSYKSLTPSKSKQHIQQLYFCHYKNGMYMGSVQNFQKHGLGLILHDNGTSILSNCIRDTLHGENVAFFSNGAGLSARYNKDRLQELVYKNKYYVYYCQYSNGKVPDGGAILISIREEKIEYVSYRNGVIEKKSIEKDKNVLSRVFVQKRYDDVISKDHLLNLDFQGKIHSEISVCRKAGKILVGYTKDDFMLNGLGFVLAFKSGKQGESDIEMLQRGFYKNSQLSGFGQRNFKNGNNYIGEFRYDQFEGSGVLKNAEKNNWVSGNFQKGSLVELLTYGNTGDDKPAHRILQTIHQSKTSWVDKDLISPSQSNIQKQIQMIKRYTVDVTDNILEKKRTDILRKIQDNFVNPEEDDEGSIQYPDSLKNSGMYSKDLRSHTQSQRQQNFSYSLIKQNCSEFLISSRRNPLELSPQNHTESNNNPNKSSFRFDVKPVPNYQTPKPSKSPSHIIPIDTKTKSSRNQLSKSPNRGRKTTPVKSSISQSKIVTNNLTKSKTNNVAPLNLIDQRYHKSVRTKLF